MKNELLKVLETQTQEGFFPTYRAEKGNKIKENPEARVDNIGAHAFVLEKILQLNPRNPLVREAFQNGLDYLLSDAVEYKSRKLWGWLKKPLKEDWFYPPDADDTARARIVIELAKINGFNIPEEFRDFDYAELIEEGMTPLGGRLTFIGFKPDDSICPVVNANLLNAYYIHLGMKGKSVKDDSTPKKIIEYLERTIRTSEFQSSDFSRCSKFYLSHNLLAYLISFMKELFDGDTLDIIKKRIEKENGQYKNPMEAALATTTLKNLGGNEETIGKGIKQIQDNIGSNYLWSPEPFYQHQRSRSIFGSSACTSVFCLETLSKCKEELR